MDIDWVMARDGARAFEVSVYEGHGAIVRNAVALLQGELERRYGVDGSPASQVSGSLIIEEPHLGADDDQSYHIRTEGEGEKRTLILNGSGERGVLYGICEILDRIEVRQGVVGLPAFAVTSSPVIKKRGTERHWGPELHTPEGVEENVKLIRALARRRVNTLLWIDGWVSPGWYRFLEFRHYPPLARPADDAVRRAKECLRRVVEEARAWGMEFYIGTTEFNVPERLLEVSPEIFHTNASGFPVLMFDHEGTWAFYRAKVREMMEDVPGLAGVELWTAEAMDPGICHVEAPAAWPLTKRLSRMYEQTLQAMDEAGHPDARVICSAFIHDPQGERAYEPLCGQLPDRCDGRMKMQVEDYYRFNAPTTLAGRISPGREWIEFDPAGEHRGDWIGWVTVHLNYIHERMRHYHERGVRNFICRIRGFSTGPHARFVGDLAALEGVQSIKDDAFFAWCWDLDLPLETVWRRWKRPGWPDEMLEFFLLSEALSDKTQNVGACLVNNNHASFLGSVEHYEMKMRLLDVYGNDACRAKGWILEPTEKNLALIVAEKDEALAAAERMQQILATCAGRLPSDDAAELRAAMAYQLACVRVWRHHTEAFFRYRLYALNLPGGEYDKLMKAVKACEVEIRELRQYDEQQADNAYALIGSIKSLAWVAACSRQMTPKGIIRDP